MSVKHSKRSAQIQFRAAVAVLALAALFGVTATAEAASLERVEAEKVCMTNDAYFGKPQIPVQVEGKTYYGCCQGCVEALTNDAALRTAADPVSGKKVDKAEAVIGMLPNGHVLYFESEASFRAYKAGR